MIGTAWPVVRDGTKVTFVTAAHVLSEASFRGNEQGSAPPLLVLANHQYAWRRITSDQVTLHPDQDVAFIQVELKMETAARMVLPKMLDLAKGLEIAPPTPVSALGFPGALQPPHREGTGLVGYAGIIPDGIYRVPVFNGRLMKYKGTIVDNLIVESLGAFGSPLKNAYVYLIDAVVEEGCSGGVVLTTKRDIAIGMLVMTLNLTGAPNSGVSVVVPSMTINRLLVDDGLR